MNDHEDMHLSDSVKRVSGLVWQGLEYRIELLANELQEDKRRLLVLVALSQVAFLSAFMAFLSLNVLIFVLFWNTNRTTVAIALSAFYLAVTVAVAAVIRWRSKNAPHPFATTIEELKKDRAALTRREP